MPVSYWLYWLSFPLCRPQIMPVTRQYCGRHGRHDRYGRHDGRRHEGSGHWGRVGTRQVMLTILFWFYNGSLVCLVLLASIGFPETIYRSKLGEWTRRNPGSCTDGLTRRFCIRARPAMSFSYFHDLGVAISLFRPWRQMAQIETHIWTSDRALVLSTQSLGSTKSSKRQSPKAPKNMRGFARFKGKMTTILSAVIHIAELT